MNVLSVCNGLSGAQIALSNHNVCNYYSSEIDNAAMKLNNYNFPSTIQLGSIEKIDVNKIEKIDILVGGTPCQGFSINGNRLNFEDERSKLFFEFIRLKNELNPKYFLLENVATMSKEVKLKIDEFIGVKGIYINSNSFVPQNRKRFYWTNIPFEIPVFISEFKIRHILDDVIDSKLYWKEDKINKQLINPTETDGVITVNPKNKQGKQTYQQDRIYCINGRFPSLTATLGNRFNIRDDFGIRKLSITEQARLQGIPNAYQFDAVSEQQASKCIGNGFTIDVVKHIFNHIA